MNTRGAISLNGGFDEVAAFFHVSARTVWSWRAAEPPVIGSWQEGKNVVFGEDHVVELWVRRERRARGLTAAEAEARARKLWREHLRLCQADRILPELEEILARLQRLEENQTPHRLAFWWAASNFIGLQRLEENQTPHSHNLAAA